MVEAYRCEVLTRVRALQRGKERLLIRIAGGSGSGKGHVAKRIHTWLVRDITSTTLLEQDPYYLGRDAAPDGNFDRPSAIDLDRYAADLRALLRGETVARPVYDFARHERMPASVQVSPASVIIAEGMFLLPPHLSGEWPSLDIFVDAPDEVRYARRAFRDERERGRSLDSIGHQWAATVQPMFVAHILPQRAAAHLIIENAEYVPPGGPYTLPLNNPGGIP